MQFEVVVQDITTFEADAIVNAANATLLGGGGVDGAIHRAAGKELLEYCKTLNGCKTGEAKITPGFKLPAKYVIHTPGPVFRSYSGNPEKADELLGNSYRNSLKLAEETGCSSIGFSSISTGVYAFPLDRAAKIVRGVFVEFAKTNPKNLRRVAMVCFDETTANAYRKAFEGL